MEMPDVIYMEHCDDDRKNKEYVSLYEGNWTTTEYHHSRIVEALKAENEQLRNKLKPHPNCDRSCMYLAVDKTLSNTNGDDDKNYAYTHDELTLQDILENPYIWESSIRVVTEEIEALKAENEKLKAKLEKANNAPEQL